MWKIALAAVVAGTACLVTGVYIGRGQAHTTPAEAVAEELEPATRSIAAQKARMCLNNCHARTDLVLGAVLSTMETPHAATAARPSLNELQAWVRDSVQYDVRRGARGGTAAPEGWE